MIKYNQKGEVKMKPTIEQLRTGQINWPILNTVVDNWLGLEDKELNAVIDGIWAGCQTGLLHTCVKCGDERYIQMGDSSCDVCNQNVYRGEV
tara:strand:+ start:173 stop:448 length:276 start_codon:yes stop_codon:yes gene_type:complete